MAPGSEAERHGVPAGARIDRIADEPAAGMSAARLASLLAGARPITLDVTLPAGLATEISPSLVTLPAGLATAPDRQLTAAIGQPQTMPLPSTLNRTLHCDSDDDAGLPAQSRSGIQGEDCALVSQKEGVARSEARLIAGGAGWGPGQGLLTYQFGEGPIGMLVGSEQGEVHVTAVAEGGAAQQVGLQRGSRLAMINYVPVEVRSCQIEPDER